MSIGLTATVKLHPQMTQILINICVICVICGLDCIICVICENLWPMLQFLNISNIALIEDMQVEFESGLNLLTGETGSGKSIIVDALGVLIGGRFTSELLKSGTERGSIEGLFSVASHPDLAVPLANAGVARRRDLTVRRDASRG